MRITEQFYLVFKTLYSSRQNKKKQKLRNAKVNDSIYVHHKGHRTFNRFNDSSHEVIEHDGKRMKKLNSYSEEKRN
jgi:hypothetical protein